MNKRGQIEILGAGIVLMIVLFSGLYILKTDSGNNVLPSEIKYVGNTQTKQFCSISLYDHLKIPEKNRIFFVTEQDAMNYNLKYSDRCD